MSPVIGYECAVNNRASQSGARRTTSRRNHSPYPMRTAATGMTNTHRCGIQLRTRDCFGLSPGSPLGLRYRASSVNRATCAAVQFTPPSAPSRAIASEGDSFSVPFEGSASSGHDSPLPIRFRLSPSEQPTKEFLIRTKICPAQAIHRNAEIDDPLIRSVRQHAERSEDVQVPTKCLLAAVPVVDPWTSQNAARTNANSEPGATCPTAEGHTHMT
jgi:hypothetical protein